MTTSTENGDVNGKNSYVNNGYINNEYGTFNDENGNVNGQNGDVRDTNNRFSFQIDTDFIPAKLCYFLANMRQSSYLPVLNVFLTDIGLTTAEAGVITGTRLVGQLLGAPFFGMVADKSRKYLLVLTCLIFMSNCLMLPQPWIPLWIGAKCVENGTASFNSSTPNNATSISSVCTKKDNEAMFFVFLVMNLLMAFFDGYLNPFVDAAVMEQIKQSSKNVDYGRQRVFGALGFSCGAFVTSLVAKLFSSQSGLSPYSAAFVVYSVTTASFLVCARFLLRKTNMHTAQDGNIQVLTIFLKTLRNCHVLFFLATVLVSGMFNGLHISFVLVLMKDMDSPTVIMGLTITLAAAGSIFLFNFTTRIIHVLHGLIPTMASAAFSWAILFTIYGFSTSPYAVFGAQVLHCFCFATFISAAVQYTREISSKEVVSSMFGLYDGLYFGAGNMLANLIGGVTYQHFGGSKMFRGTAAVAITWSLIVMGYHMISSSMQKKRDAEDDMTDPDIHLFALSIEKSWDHIRSY